MNTAAIDTDLPALFARLMGCQTIWDNDPRPIVTPPALATLLAFGAVSIGSDARCYSRAPDGGWGNAPHEDPWPGVPPKALESTIGVREVTVRVRVETYVEVPGERGRTYLDRLVGRLGWTSSRLALEAMGLGFQSILSFIDLPTTIDDHVYSWSVLDLRFNASTAETDTDHEYDTIERVNVRNRR